MYLRFGLATQKLGMQRETAKFKTKLKANKKIASK